MTQRDWRMPFTLYYLSEKEKVESAPGNEWYYTTLEELKEIFEFVLNGTEPISELRKPEGNDEDYSI